MNSVNKTLYIPLYGKSYVSKRGIFLDDKKAEEIWEAEGFALKGKSKSKWLAYYMGVRSAVFDEWVKKQVADVQDAVVIHIGCGMDSRVLRVGTINQKWYDIDFAALSNIELSNDGGQLAALLGEEYLIHYMVDLESRGSLLDVEAFSNPFAYTMKVTEKNECKERNIDLCETFNYLIGLTVNNQSDVSYFLSKPGEKPAYEGAVDLVSDISGQYAFRQIEGTLPDGRRALVIWRTVTDDVIASNAALDAYFTTYRKNAQDRKYDVIFVNGDSNLENLRGSSEGWKMQVTELEFKKRMFEEV